MHGRRAQGLCVMCAFMMLTTACGTGGEVEVANLISQWPVCRKQPDESAFTITTATLAGRASAAIGVRGATRLTCHVTVPPSARAHMRVGAEGDSGAIRFSIGISDGHAYRELRTLVLDPRSRAADGA